MITLLTMNYRKINNNICKALTLNETHTYMMLALKSDYETHESKVNQKTLANESGKSVDTIKDHLYKMEKLGLIETVTMNGEKSNLKFKKNKYTIKYDTAPEYDEPEHWVNIDVGLLSKENISKELKGFLIKLKICCYNYTNYCHHSTRELAERMGMGKTSVDNYLRKAEELGYIKWKRDESIELTNKEIFIIARETEFASIKGFHEIVLDDFNFDSKGHMIK